MKLLAIAGSVFVALPLLAVFPAGASELSRSSEATSMAAAESATEAITLRVHGMMKSRSGAT